MEEHETAATKGGSRRRRLLTVLGSKRSIPRRRQKPQQGSLLRPLVACAYRKHEVRSKAARARGDDGTVMLFTSDDVLYDELVVRLTPVLPPFGCLRPTGVNANLNLRRRTEVPRKTPRRLVGSAKARSWVCCRRCRVVLTCTPRTEQNMAERKGQPRRSFRRVGLPDPSGYQQRSAVSPAVRGGGGRTEAWRIYGPAETRYVGAAGVGRFIQPSRRQPAPSRRR